MKSQRNDMQPQQTSHHRQSSTLATMLAIALVAVATVNIVVNKPAGALSMAFLAIALAVNALVLTSQRGWLKGPSKATGKRADLTEPDALESRQSAQEADRR